jgi:hypothetical protein
MHHRTLVAASLVIAIAVLCPCASAGTKPTTAPTSQPAEEKAYRELNEQMAELDADYRARKADLLRRYAQQLAGAQKAAMRDRDTDDAQRIFELITATNAMVLDLSPQPANAKVVAAPFKVTIRDFNGAAGYTEVVKLSATEISVTSESDWGQPPKVIWHAALTADQQAQLAKFIRQFPLDKLKDAYVDRTVFDGFQVTFMIQIGDGPERKITVANQRQKDLERLMDAANDLLPPKLHMSRMSD